VIAPNYVGYDELPSAQLEAQDLIDRFGATAGPVRRPGVRRLLRDGGFEIVHFSGHGSYDPDLVELSAIELLDGSLNPGDLPRPSTNGSAMRPFVFMNACEVGELGYDLMALGGWASEFCRRGFSGFVGPYWAVDDEIAGKASATFYDELRRGRTVAEAVQSIRLRFNSDPHPSWLAYTVHCQPNVTIGISAGA
jgi:CHAT domain-containing protein